MSMCKDGKPLGVLPLQSQIENRVKGLLESRDNT